MRKSEKVAITRAYSCLSKIVGMYPSNPCDIGPLASCALTAHEAGDWIGMALLEIRDGNIELAEDHLETAEDCIQKRGLRR